MSIKARILPFFALPAEYQKALTCDDKELANSAYQRYEFQNTWDWILVQSIILTIIGFIVLVYTIFTKHLLLGQILGSIKIILVILLIGIVAFLKVKVSQKSKLPSMRRLLLVDKELLYYYGREKVFVFPFNLLVVTQNNSNDLVFSAEEFSFVLNPSELQSAICAFLQFFKNIPPDDKRLSSEKIFEEFAGHLLSRGSQINLGFWKTADGRNLN